MGVGGIGGMVGGIGGGGGGMIAEPLLVSQLLEPQQLVSLPIFQAGAVTFPEELGGGTILSDLARQALSPYADEITGTYVGLKPLAQIEAERRYIAEQEALVTQQAAVRMSSWESEVMSRFGYTLEEARKWIADEPARG